ncbi:hypothetical protein CK203_041006 [Vitis vinifera]|uniref:Retrotransposon Copia-like N-terminal domain-containing protein n=1 Tax=Vitis vinifera TaxID=29760 RepID=A0A438CW09_VITVI|nr:hypothetical protein CK203_095446 [Vitis vinifera]RVW88337.1 hypothetical protein CK203_041006 [Vitis vinifera]
MGSPSAFNNSPLHLAIEKLNGKNCKEWAQAIKLIIDGKGKLGFLTGETQRPSPTDAVASQKWQSENSFITSCSINSMKPAIGKTTQDMALADEARRLGSHGILHRDARFVVRARSQLQRGMGVHRPEASTLVTRGPHARSSPRQSKRTYCEHFAGKGSIRIYESITLNPVLHDLSSGKMIGSAKEREGLYYFDEANVRGQCPLTVCYFASSPRESGLLLW